MPVTGSGGKTVREPALAGVGASRDTAPRGRQLAKPLPAEGEGGLFTQSWFPICLSSEVGKGEVKGYGFLDGRVIVFRGDDGIARVTSAYCPHVGADLAVGNVVGNNIRCAFHHWEYGGDGTCVKTGVGDPPPPRASLFRFPSHEKFGIVWAYNGVEPHYDLPDFPYPDEELEFRTLAIDTLMPVDPWVLCANTPDFQHIRALHGVQFDRDPVDEVEWTDHSMMYNFSGSHKQGEEIDNRVGIFGTSLYYQHTLFNGKWFGFLSPFGMPEPGKSKAYMVVAVRKDMGTPEEAQAFIDFVVDLETQIVMEDVMVMQTIRFAPANLTKSDNALSKFFSYLRNFPRAHPSAGFIG
jgi:phenylpropionate dioxygenase-like ring-hydroxylating dioxygenase large terminal subunit